MKIDVVGFVNDGARSRIDVLTPILVKVAIVIAMVTLATVLYFTSKPWIGIIIYAKEVLELILFVWYIRKKRRVR